MPSRWTPSFDVYEARIDEKRIIFVLDMEAAEHAPLASHPIRLQLRVAMRQPREDGMRSSDESDELHALEDKIVGRLERGPDAVYVGRFVAEGYTTFVFYVPRAFMEHQNGPIDFIGDVSPYEPQWLTEHDPEWEFYGEFLFPDTYSLQSMSNRKLLQILMDKGEMDGPILGNDERSRHWKFP